MCVHRIMAITSAFQADDVGSIPTARSTLQVLSPLIPNQNKFSVFLNKHLTVFKFIYSSRSSMYSSVNGINPETTLEANHRQDLKD